MNDALKEKLEEASCLDKTWTPTIMMPLDHQNNLEDFVPKLNPSSMDRTHFLSKNYPSGTSFRFFGYNGKHSNEELIAAVKKSAFASGTRLKSRRRPNPSNSRIETIEFSCVKCHLSCASSEGYNENCIQQCGTIIQPRHQSGSFKGSSRSSKLKLVKSTNKGPDSKTKRNKSSSLRPLHKSNLCSFKFKIFLSAGDGCWYLSYNKNSATQMHHVNHYRPIEDHVSLSYSHLTDEIKQYIQNSLSKHINGKHIINMVLSCFGVNITQVSINNARREYTANLLKSYGLDPAKSSCDKLLQYFRANSEISFLSVTHSVDTGFVTTRKTKGSRGMFISTEEKVNDDAHSISSDNVKTWRDALKVGDGKQLLVALAWLHEEDMRNLSLFPEMLSIDVTFGVNKEQRNLLRVCGIDGNFKVFPAFNCFMPSKQYRAFNWVCKVAFPKLVGNDILRYNTLITSDQESPLISGIRSMMGPRTMVSGDKFPLRRSIHRLDMFHIFLKEWRNNVSVFVVSF